MKEQIAEIGIREAIKRLLPHIVRAGVNACDIQDAIKKKKLGNDFANALTEADLLVENMLGGMVNALFSDASFYGEEQKKDLVSYYIPDGRPFLVTLDPVNGTKYFEDGRDCFEIIMTICDESGIRASIVYLPRRELFYYSCDKDVYTITGASAIAGRVPYTYQQPSGYHPIILIEKELEQFRPTFVAQSFGAIYTPNYDYDKNGIWDYCPARLFDGSISAYVTTDAQLIDNVAIVHLFGLAGGHVRIEGLDMKTKLAKLVVAANDPRLLEDLNAVINEIIDLRESF